MITLDAIRKAVYENNVGYLRSAVTKDRLMSDGARVSIGCYAAFCRDAINFGHREVVQLFIQQGGVCGYDLVRVSEGDSWRAPLVYIAAKVGDVATCRLLYANRSDWRKEECNNADQHTMQAALEGGHLEVVRYLLEAGVDPNDFMMGVYGSPSFLGQAALKGQKDIVALLAERGACVAAALKQNDKIFRKGYKNPEYLRGNQSLLDEQDALVKAYAYSVKLLLDHAIGTGLETDPVDRTYKALGFLKKLDVSWFNFIGVSVDGKPLTRQRLLDLGIKGADKAIFSRRDLDLIEDVDRRNELASRLEAKLRSQGEMALEDGLYNLVPLAHAAKTGSLEAVSTRLDAGGDPNEGGAIVQAAEEGFLAVVLLLANHPKIDPKLRIDASQEAREKGYIEIAVYLEFLQEVDELDSDGNALIHHAVEARDLDRIRELLGKGADINLKNKDGVTPLVLALLNIQYRHKAKPEVFEQHFALIQLLLGNSADSNIYDESSPLDIAAKLGSIKIIELLLPVVEKKDVEVFNGERNVSLPWYAPLMFDSYRSDEWIQILLLLKQYGANLNEKNEKDETPLYKLMLCFCCSCDHARFQKEFEKLDFLLKNGADPTIRCSQDQETPLEFFTRWDRIKCALDPIAGAFDKVVARFAEASITVGGLEEAKR